MLYCRNCGTQVTPDQDVCLNCGSLQKQKTEAFNVSDSGGFGWGALGFIIPMLGLILYLIWKDEKPKNAKALGIGALVSVGSAFLLIILYFVFIIILAGAML